MADESYKTLEMMNDSLWFEGSPIILCAMRLELESKSGELFASAKFLNIQPDNLRSLTVDIICYDEGRNIIDCMSGVSYSGLDVPRNSDFGYNRRIKVNDVNTRNIEFILREVTNIYNQTWDNKAGRRFNKKIEQQSIFDYQGDYNKQFLNLCSRSGIDGSMMVFEPVFTKNYWLCACGGFNWSNDKFCSQCKTGRDWLEKFYRTETLEHYKEEQLKESQKTIEQIQARASIKDDKKSEKEEFKKRKEVLEQQLRKQKGKKARKKLIIGVLVITVLGAAIYGLFGFLIPYIHYSDALKLAQDGEYDKAISEFSSLGDFMDSKEHITETKYSKASDLLRKGSYQEAADLYDEIIGYSDSRERYNTAIYSIALNQMDEASKKKDKSSYYDAIDTFLKVGSFKDAKNKLDECYEVLYQDAVSSMKSNKYLEAIKKFESLEKYNYKDVSEKISECNYLLGNKYMNMQRYAAALECYKASNGYKDSAEKLKQNMMLAAIISSATSSEPAEWVNDKITCSKCKKDTASFELSFTRDGRMYSTFNCTNHKVSEEDMNKRYRFKIENDAIFQMNYDGKTKWVKYADIYSFKPTGRGTQYEMIISDPMNSKQKISLYGNVITNEE